MYIVQSDLKNVLLPYFIIINIMMMMNDIYYY